MDTVLILMFENETVNILKIVQSVRIIHFYGVNSLEINATRTVQNV